MFGLDIHKGMFRLVGIMSILRVSSHDTFT